MMHWLAVIAKLKAIEVYQRRKKLPCQVEDWVIDLLSTVNNDAIASSRLASSDDVMDREEKEESAHQLMRFWSSRRIAQPAPIRALWQAAPSLPCGRLSSMCIRAAERVEEAGREVAVGFMQFTEEQY